MALIITDFPKFKKKLHDQPLPVGKNATTVVKSVDYLGHPYLMWKTLDHLSIKYFSAVLFLTHIS